MSKKDQVWTHLDNHDIGRVQMYQEQHEVSRSKAIRELVQKGIEAEFGGLADSFFIELAKYSAAIALTLTFVWWYTGVGQFYTYLFYGMALGSLVVHHSRANPIAALKDRLSRDASKA